MYVDTQNSYITIMAMVTLACGWYHMPKTLKASPERWKEMDHVNIKFT